MNLLNAKKRTIFLSTIILTCFSIMHAENKASDTMTARMIDGFIRQFSIASSDLKTLKSEGKQVLEVQDPSKFFPPLKVALEIDGDRITIDWGESYTYIYSGNNEQASNSQKILDITEPAGEFLQSDSYSECKVVMSERTSQDECETLIKCKCKTNMPLTEFFRLVRLAQDKKIKHFKSNIG